MIKQEVIQRANEVTAEYSIKMQDDFYQFIEKLAEVGLSDDDSVLKAVSALSKSLGSVVYELTYANEAPKETAGAVLMQMINQASEVVLQLHGDIPSNNISIVNIDDQKQCHD